MTRDDTTPSFWALAPRQPSALAEAVSRSLLEERVDWDTADDHVWTHRSGLSLWIANGAEALGLSSGHNQRARPRTGDLPYVDRRCIWRSVRQVWRDSQAETRRKAEIAFGLAGAVQ